MAGARRSWTWALAALLIAATAGLFAGGQAAAGSNPASRINGIGENAGAVGSIAGRLTDLYSAPLAGATVVVRNDATGAERRTTTARNGSYRFVELEAGEYTLEALSERLGTGHLDGIVVAAGHESRLQTAIELVPEKAVPTRNGDRAVEAEAVAIPAADRDLSERAVVAVGPLPAKLLPAEPLAEYPLMVTSAREMPATVAPTMTAELVGEPMSELAVTGRRTEDPALEVRAILAPFSRAGDTAPSVAVPTIAMAIDSETLRGLVLTGTELVGPAVTRARVDAADVDPVTPVVTTTMTAEQLQGLPVSGRRWRDFVLDTPTASSAAGGGSQTSLRGAGQEPAETTIDGASTRSAFGGTASGSGSGGRAEPSGMGQAWAGGRGFALGEAAIREVQTVAGNVEAESARAAGGRMNMETERGENGLHGQAFLFDRQNIWGARNPFTQWVKETAPATETISPTFTGEPYTPPDHETTWGVGAGSQIRRDKLFWFAALDGYQRNDPGLATVKHPYLCANPPQCTEQTGFFAQPSNDQMQVLSARLGMSSVNPVAEGLAAYSNMLGTLGGLLGPSPRTAKQWVGFGRMDWQAAERHRFTLEGIGATWNSPGGGLTRTEETYGSNSFGTSKASEDWLLGRWEAFLTPNLLAVTQGSVGRNILGTHAETPSAFEQTFLSPSIWGQLPQIVVDNRYGFTIGNPSRFGTGSYPDERLYEGQEMLDWVHGSLLVKAGFDLSHDSDATSMLRNQTGTYSYSNVENFASDALAFESFGVGGELNEFNQHNCDQTGKVWRDSGGGLRGLGYLPCYSYYSQTMGPSDWYLSTNDWAGYATAQWQPKRLFVVSAGLRWEKEQMPPPIAALSNPGLPLTEKLPSLGNDLGPRVSMTLGNTEGHWPVLRLGYGMYFGRTENATLETALTQTGSAKGDLSFFMRPTDNLNAGGAPPFPYVLAGEPASMVKPGAVEFAPMFRNLEIHQGVAALEESLPGRMELTASAMVSLGRRLPVSIDTNFDPALNPETITYGVVDGTGLGPIKTAQITVPFYASWPSTTSPTGFAGRLNPDYQQISQVMSRANSTYEALMVKLSRNARRGLSLHAHYTYAHAMDWNPNESTQVAGSDVLDPAHFNEEYGTSNLDMRHSAAVMAVWQAPWKLRGGVGRMANEWMLSGVGQFRSGLPFTMRTSGSLAEEFSTTTGAAIVGLGPGMNGSGGDNRVYGVGRNTYRYPATWKADVRLGKSFDLGEMRKLELLVESFNLFNHQNVTELETTGYYLEPGSLDGTPPTLNFLTGLKANTTAFGQPLNVNATDFYRERQVQVGVRVRF